MSEKADLFNTKQKSESKKAAVLGDGGKSRTPVAIIASALMVFAIAGYFLIGGKPAVDVAEAASVVSAADGKSINLSISDFGDGKAKFYSYEDGKGPVVRYYAVKGTDGNIHTAFDACDSCWSEGKGYKQSGDLMLCQNCRQTFPINKIGEVRGGCNPSPLPSRVEGGKLVIDVADIAVGAHYFDLPKEKRK